MIRERALDALITRPAWTRIADDQAACAFGPRRLVISIPAATTAEQFASTITRTEIRVLLGDAEFDLVAHLQTFAARELQGLFALR